MSKIVPFKNWDAHAALSAAMSETVPGDSVLILREKENGQFMHYTANMKNSQLVYLCEMVKHELLERVIDEQ